MSRAAGICAAILILVIAALVLIPALVGTEPFGASITVVHYKNGEIVTGPFAFMQDGTEIDELGVTVEWYTTGSDQNTFVWESLVVTGNMRWYIIVAGEYSAYDEITVLEEKNVDLSRLNPWTVRKMLIDVLPMEYSSVGWELHCWASLHASVEDIYGEGHTASWSGEVEHNYSWKDSNFVFGGIIR